MNEHDDSETASMTQTFGPVAVRLLDDQPLHHAWRISFLANFFTGPFYRDLGERHAISRPEFVILLGLSQQPALLARDICLATGLPKNSISRAVSDLLRKGLVAAEVDATDRRAKSLTLTSAGADLLSQVLPAAEARQAAMRRALTADEADHFDRLLIKLIRAMPEWVDVG